VIRLFGSTVAPQLPMTFKDIQAEADSAEPDEEAAPAPPPEPASRVQRERKRSIHGTRHHSGDARSC
jgi:hypothetical protein